MIDGGDRALQERIIRVALPAAQQYGFAIAGGHVLRLHGVIDRMSEDVDMFTNSVSTQEFALARTAVIDALRADDLTVEIDERRGPQFARLFVSDHERTTKLELGYDWRGSETTMLPVGPVLSREDSVATKALALWGRTAAKDAIDVNAYLASGEFTPDQILYLAHEHDAGFLPTDFARSLRRVVALSDSDYAIYGADPHATNEIRRRLTTWAIAIEGNASAASDAAAPTTVNDAVAPASAAQRFEQIVEVESAPIIQPKSTGTSPGLGRSPQH